MICADVCIYIYVMNRMFNKASPAQERQAVVRNQGALSQELVKQRAVPRCFVFVRCGDSWSIVNTCSINLYIHAYVHAYVRMYVCIHTYA